MAEKFKVGQVEIPPEYQSYFRYVNKQGEVFVTKMEHKKLSAEDLLMRDRAEFHWLKKKDGLILEIRGLISKKKEALKANEFKKAEELHNMIPDIEKNLQELRGCSMSDKLNKFGEMENPPDEFLKKMQEKRDKLKSQVAKTDVPETPVGEKETEPESE